MHFHDFPLLSFPFPNISSLIFPVIAIYKMIRSHASRGHTISFQQNIYDFAPVLSRIPEELPVIVLKSPNETTTDRYFLVRRDKLIGALQCHNENNEDYRHIQISTQNASMYPQDAIVPSVPLIDPLLQL